MSTESARKEPPADARSCIARPAFARAYGASDSRQNGPADAAAFVSISAAFPTRGSPVTASNARLMDGPSFAEEKPSVRSLLGPWPTGALREVAFAEAVKCPGDP